MNEVEEESRMTPDTTCTLHRRTETHSFIYAHMHTPLTHTHANGRREIGTQKSREVWETCEMKGAVEVWQSSAMCTFGFMGGEGRGHAKGCHEDCGKYKQVLEIHHIHSAKFNKIK